MPLTAEEPIRLGLIGDNIAASSAPRLHRLAGELAGLPVRYDRLVPKVEGLDFESLFHRCAERGYRGLNITYPYKERVLRLVKFAEPALQAIGAVNTVRFTDSGPMAHNTDYTGFMAAYEGLRGTRAPGVVALIGTGGVGRAIAFGLARLGAEAIRLFDVSPQKSEALARDLGGLYPALRIEQAPGAEEAARGATGIVNATPVGMVGLGGIPIAASTLPAAGWAFDAVYTPVDTPFLIEAERAGLQIVSGWELFYWQGVHAWTIFTDLGVDRAALRARLEDLAQSSDV
ncbi:shikimate dehydrogenase family protein [Rhodobacter sp. NSM]|uniref:shikimate dehydrogenase family protein n=1 Tax=Rhodobacter sp. NSM TaxID=3457501 RepID=UPI003FD43E50